MAEPIGCLLDTSVFVAREQRRPADLTRIPQGPAVSVVTLAELRLAVLTAKQPDLVAKRLATLEAATAVEPIRIDAAVASHWATLRANAASFSQSRVNDLWIAATALALGVPIVSQDQGFARLESIGGPKAIII
ncbi:MAG: PIN domain-containing protein [Bifidobacteriaceae bacterium]|nr:PIN domain-containing protein [Bifidobacteriaceae bacterium]